MNPSYIGGAVISVFARRRAHWRRRRLIRTIIAGGLAAAMFSLAEAQTPAPTNAAQRPVRLLVKPKSKNGPSPSGAISGSKVKRVFSSVGNLEVVELPAGLPAQTALAILKQLKEVEYAETDQVVHLRSTEPNDFRWPGGELWGLHNTGYLGGTPGADIKAPEAWDIRHDAPNIIVALVDSGVRQTHEDLAPNLWSNPREIPGNGIDDDGNGVIDDVHGFNAWLDNGNPEDDLGHGTHVAGSIGAAGNNTVGVVGVAWKVQLMATKFTDPQGNGTVSDAIACIDYARQMGAHIINASWGAPDLFNSVALRDAIAAARDAGIIFVTVAGNNAGDNDATLYYPGAFDLDNIVVVTATDRNDQLASFANYGAKTVDLGAPGHNIFSCWIGSDSDYQYYNGGSMAVAHVSGAAALLRAHFPGDTHQATIKRILDNTDPLPSLLGKTRTGGRLNLFKALGGTTALPVVTLAATDSAAAESGPDNAVFTVTRSGATVAPLTVLYNVSGTATNGTDYSALTGTVTIPAGAASAAIVLQPIDDTQYEGDETVILTLAPATAYTVGTAATATAIIADNDPPPLPTVTVAATDANAAEAGSDAGAFTISRTGPTSTALTVAIALAGTATNGSDYQSIANSAVIPVGAASVLVTVRPIDDMEIEGNETVTLTISPASAYTVGSAKTATVTIADNDTLPVVSVSATDAAAAEAGPDDGTFTVTRTGSTTAALTVGFSLGGTATNSSDYQTIGNSVTIPAGAASATIRVRPIDDSQVEGDETVVLALGANPLYVIGSGANATVTIADNDLPTVTITAPISITTELGLINGTFQISRTGSTAAPLTVMLAFSGTATNGTDYERMANSVTIPAGKSSTNLVVRPIRDGVEEPTETIVLSVAPNAKYTVGTASRSTIYLFDESAVLAFFQRLRGDGD